MQMNCIPEGRIRALLASERVRLLDIKITNSTDPGFNGDLRFFEGEPTEGWVSKQYCVLK